MGTAVPGFFPETVSLPAGCSRSIYFDRLVGLAAGIYLGLGGIIGKEAASWLCLLAAAPVAIAGFFHYNGMTLEQFLWAFIKSEILCAGPRRFDSVNLHEEVFASIMEDTLE